MDLINSKWLDSFFDSYLTSKASKICKIFNNLLTKGLANQVDKTGLHTVATQSLPRVDVFHQGQLVVGSV